MNADTQAVLPDWARAAGRPSAAARIRASDDDFAVTERLGFEPDGDGEHDFLFAEKRGLNTAQVAAALARHAGVPRREVGFAGMKDRNAVTAQWFSVKRPARRTVDWAAFTDERVALRIVSRHRRKLKRGAHRGNHFRLILRDVVDPEATLDTRLRALGERGVPNYFGEQRFGRGGRNIELARSLFAGERLAREQRSIALSAARSLIFNELLSARVAAGTWDRLQAGDVAGLDGSGSVFAVDTLDEDLERRAAAMDVHSTGPLWGSGASLCQGAVAESELAAACVYPELREGLEATTRAARRQLRTVARDLEWAWQGQDLVLDFALDRGAFATAVLRELVSYQQ